MKLAQYVGIGLTALALGLTSQDAISQAANIKIKKVNNSVDFGKTIPKINSELLQTFKGTEKINEIVSYLHTYAKKKGVYVVIEGSKEHRLYVDSLTLSRLRELQGKIDKFPEDLSTITQRNHVDGGNNIPKIQNKFLKPSRYESIAYNYRTEGLFTKKSINKEDDISYFWYGDIYHTKIGNNIRIYFKPAKYIKEDKERESAGLVAYHPTIQPDHLCSNNFGSQIHASHFKKPTRKITTISKKILIDQGVTDEKEQKSFITAINTGKKFYQTEITNDIKKADSTKGIVASTKVIETNNVTQVQQEKKMDTTNNVDVSNIQNRQAKILHINPSEINNFIINVSDYEVADLDRIAITGQHKEIVELDKKGIDFDIRTLCNKQILIEILNEGTQPPNTLKIKWGNKEQIVSGKKGDIILIQVED